MGGVLRTSVGWFQGHPLTVSIILFFAAALISIYSTEIKHFLHHWPRTRKALHSSTRSFLTNRVVLLERLHNNAYEVLMYLT